MKETIAGKKDRGSAEADMGDAMAGIDASKALYYSVVNMVVGAAID
jgi:hypothetical protein